MGEIAHLGEEGEDLVAACAAAGAELEPAFSDVIEHRHALGDLHGMVHLGERVEDPRADVDPLGGMGKVAGDDVVGRQVGVLVEEMVLGQPHVLEPGPIRSLHQLEVVHDHIVFGVGFVLAPRLGYEVLDEKPKFHDVHPPRWR